jgi:hypothetical protein
MYSRQKRILRDFLVFVFVSTACKMAKPSQSDDASDSNQWASGRRTTSKSQSKAEKSKLRKDLVTDHNANGPIQDNVQPVGTTKFFTRLPRDEKMASGNRNPITNANTIASYANERDNGKNALSSWDPSRKETDQKNKINQNPIRVDIETHKSSHGFKNYQAQENAGIREHSATFGMVFASSDVEKSTIKEGPEIVQA